MMPMKHLQHIRIKNVINLNTGMPCSQMKLLNYKEQFFAEKISKNCPRSRTSKMLS